MNTAPSELVPTFLGGEGGRGNPGKEYPMLIEPVRELLKRIGKPYVIENVPGAPAARILRPVRESWRGKHRMLYREEAAAGNGANARRG